MKKAYTLLIFLCSCLCTKVNKEDVFSKVHNGGIISDEFEKELEEILKKGAFEGNLEEVKKAFENGAKDLKRKALSDILTLAAKAGHLEIMSFLLGNGVGSCYEALKEGARNGHEKVVEFLLDGDVREEYYTTAIDHANGGRHFKLAEMVIEKWISFSYERPKWGRVLLYAAMAGSVKMVNFIIEKGADNYNEALWRASDYGHLDVAKLLIEKGANSYNYAMAHGAEIGHMEMVNFMLEKGADDYSTAMVYAARGGHMEIVKMMIEREPNCYFKMGMYWAARSGKNGHREIVELMMEKGANYHGETMKVLTEDRFDDVRKSILRVFAYEANPKYIPEKCQKELRRIEERLKKNPILDFENTFLNCGIKCGLYRFSLFLPPEIMMEIFKYLDVKNRVELIFLYSNKDIDQEELRYVEENEWNEYIPIDRKDENGVTMLHKLCYYGHRNKVDFLVEKRALKNMENGEGKTPLWYAKQGAITECFICEGEKYVRVKKKSVEWIEKLESLGFR